MLIDALNQKYFISIKIYLLQRKKYDKSKATECTNIYDSIIKIIINMIHYPNNCRDSAVDVMFKNKYENRNKSGGPTCTSAGGFTA